MGPKALLFEVLGPSGKRSPWRSNVDVDRTTIVLNAMVRKWQEQVGKRDKLPADTGSHTLLSAVSSFADAVTGSGPSSAIKQFIAPPCSREAFSVPLPDPWAPANEMTTIKVNVRNKGNSGNSISTLAST